MKTKFLLILLFVGVIIFTAFVTNKKSYKPEYAILKYSIWDKSMVIDYENGETENVITKLNLKLKFSFRENNFIETVKVFKYLNEKGFKLQTNSYTGPSDETQICIFIKE
ncbi:MAG: hypothetical protein WCO28_08440 [Bacteroidota bacterium]